jgi:hypothetical protein
VFRLLIGGVIVLVIGLSFLVTRVLDDLAPAGSTDVITVWDQSASPSDQFQKLVARTAEAHDMTVMKEVRTESGSAVVRREYVANPAAARSFRLADHDVTGFDPSLVTRLLPLSDLPSNRINGMYLTDAGTTAANRFAASLGDEGVTVTVHPLSPLPLSLWVASEIPAVPLGAAVLLVVAVGVVAWQASRRKIVAITASLGRTRATSIRRDAAAVALGMTAAGAVGITLTASVLLVIDGVARVDLFVAVTAAGVALTTGFAVLVVVLSAVVARASITRGIDGARPWRSVLTVSIVSNVLVLALASSAATTAQETITLAHEDATERSAWRSSLDDVRLSFFSSNADLDAAESALAATFTSLDGAGAVILADHVVVPDRDSHAPDDGNVLLVNAEYLDAQTIRSPSGARVTPTTLDSRAMTLLTPEGVRVSDGDKRAWRRFLRFQRSNSAHPETIPTDIELRTLPTATHRVFTYATDDLRSTSVQRDTVIAVIPSATPSMSENLIVSDMTSGEVIFTDPELLRADLAAHDLTKSVAMVEPLRDAVSYRSVVIDRASRQALMAVGVLALVLALSAASTCQALAMIRRRRTVIMSSHGRSTTRALATALAVPVLAIAAAGSVITLAASDPARPVTLGCIVVDVVMVVFATAVHGRRPGGPGPRHPRRKQ